MNKLPFVLMLALLAPSFSVRAQNPPPPLDPDFVKFDIDFPGGPPSKLVLMITNRTRQSLNVIVPSEYATTELPPLSLRSVTVPQIFEAIGKSSRKTVPRITGWNSFSGGGRTPTYQFVNSSFGFRTAGDGSLTPDTVWYFFVEQPPQIPDVPEPPDPKLARTCRFFQLGPYLDQGKLKVEDITTALETAWKMLGEKTMPDLKFHKETRLLIAVGEWEKLALIEQVLTQLPNSEPSNPAAVLPVQGGSVAPVKTGRIIPPEPTKRPPDRP